MTDDETQIRIIEVIGRCLAGSDGRLAEYLLSRVAEWKTKHPTFPPYTESYDEMASELITRLADIGYAISPAAPSTGQNPMTQAPATGLWGCPDDYGPDFETLEEMFETTDWYAPLADTLNSERMLDLVKRSEVVTALITLAHDLDARGLVLVPSEPSERMIEVGNTAYFDGRAWDVWDAMISAGVVETPPLPLPADAEGER